MFNENDNLPDGFTVSNRGIFTVLRNYEKDKWDVAEKTSGKISQIDSFELKEDAVELAKKLAKEHGRPLRIHDKNNDLINSHSY